MEDPVYVLYISFSDKFLGEHQPFQIDRVDHHSIQMDSFSALRLCLIGLTAAIEHDVDCGGQWCAWHQLFVFSIYCKRVGHLATSLHHEHYGTDN